MFDKEWFSGRKVDEPDEPDVPWEEKYAAHRIIGIVVLVIVALALLIG